jgi:hypothetical protein
MIEMIIRIVLSLAIIELAVPLANVNASGLGSFSYINFEGGGGTTPFIVILTIIFIIIIAYFVLVKDPTNNR